MKGKPAGKSGQQPIIKSLIAHPSLSSLMDEYARVHNNKAEWDRALHPSSDPSSDSPRPTHSHML